MEREIRKCVLWGMGEDYESVLNQLLFEIEKKNMRVMAAVVREKDKYCTEKDGFRVIVKDDLLAYEFDYLIIMSVRFFDEIKEEACKLGVPSERIINGKVFNLPRFDFARYANLIENPVTILSDDCWGGYVYNRLQLPFSSPLINTLFAGKEYAKFIQDPLFYLGTELVMEREGSLEEDLCPVGRLGNDERTVKIQFVHAVTFEEAQVEWNRRRKRINPQNIFVKMGFDRKEKDHEFLLDSFEKVQYSKILFYYSKTNIERVFYTERLFEQCRRNGFTRYYTYNNMVRESYQQVLDVLKLLNGEEDYSREKY